MILTKTFPIVHKTKTLFNLNFEFLDVKIFELFENNSKNITKTKSQHPKALALLLNCFLGLQSKKLSLLNFLNKKSTNIILSEFIWFLNNNGFNIGKQLTVSYRNSFLKIIEEINMNKNVNIQIDLNISFDVNKIQANQIIYFNGWWLKLKDEKYEQSIPLHGFYNKFGHENTEVFFNQLKQSSIENSNLWKLSFRALNSFILFLSDNADSPFDWNKELIVKSFLKDFFIKKDKNNHNLFIAKKLWNSFNKLAQKLFDLPEDLIFNINTKGQKTFEHNIKVNINGQIKVKLITEIPLEICDDKALTILIQKINQEVDFVKDWANQTIFSFVELTKNKNNLLKSYNYGKQLRYIPKSELINFNKNTVFQKKHALAIAYLLIAEHPEITESFLLSCDFDNSIKETDQGTYLVSYKNRKGPNLAEQKILLNKTSLNLIKILLEETNIIREYLKNTNNTDYKNLFICCNSSGLFPSAPKVLNEREGANRDTNKSIINFLINERGLEEKFAIEFANKITLTKMRASRGVQIYLTTESTTKMAQALGHTRHRPELLAHYLPEPIMDFFQRRWISIFQKGIICEAFKDSEFLLKATGFSSMTQLDEFLKNHTLKKIPDNSDLIMNKNSKSVQITDNSETYISVDEHKLSALLSVQKAVNEAENKFKIAPTAYYWSLFTERLIKEISENRIYSSFKPILNIAKENINKELFKEIIYVE